MKILQFGAGSMGKRRLRDFSARGDVELALVDPRPDRREHARQTWGVQTFENTTDALAWAPDALSISTPPDQHRELVDLALQRGRHHFCEANIWTRDYERVRHISAAKGLVSAVSASLLFMPAVKELKRVVAEDLGNLHSYQMMLSVNLLAWHPGEGDEYYAMHRSTVAGREMVPFELSMLNSVFGFPTHASGTVSRRGKLAVDSEDTWHVQMTLASGATGQLAVEMASPAVCRWGSCVGDNGVVGFDLLAGTITRDLPALGIKDIRAFGTIKEVLEPLYREETDTFVDAILGSAGWPYTYEMSAMTTAVLAAAEISHLTGRLAQVDPSTQPAATPTDYQLG